MTKIADAHPPRHAKYIVKRDGCLFTATPCYGMHNPWWVVTTMEGEAAPTYMDDTDEWEVLEKYMKAELVPRDIPAAIRVMMMPRDTNPNGTIFGGVILSYIDQAGAIGAQQHTKETLVTVAMDKIEFLEPVFVGDVVSFFTSLIRIGTSSITIKVEVEALRSKETKPIPVTSATLVFVAVNNERKPIPVVVKP